MVRKSLTGNPSGDVASPPRGASELFGDLFHALIVDTEFSPGAGTQYHVLAARVTFVMACNA